MSDTRPPLDVERLALALSCWGSPITGEGDPEFVPWAEQVIRSHLAAAYQPTGPDDLAGPCPVHGDGCSPYCEGRRPVEDHVGPHTLVSSTCPACVTLTGVRSSEVDGLRQRLARIEGLAWSDTYHALREEGVAEDRAMAHADIVRNALTDRIAAALTGDTGPKVEPEP